MRFDIIYEDSDLIVCYKPAGLASQTARIAEDDMVSLLKNYRVSRGEDSYVGMVSRLDQGVEGLMVFGKNKQTTAALSKQLEDKRLYKIYLAAVKDWAMDDSGQLEDYLLKYSKSNVSRVVSSDTKGAKRASLNYEVIDVSEKRTIISIKLDTGRHHQIRLQLANAGSPILGDKKYGPKNTEAMHNDSNYRSSKLSMNKSQLGLCASQVHFVHPSSKEEMNFSIEPRNEIFK